MRILAALIAVLALVLIFVLRGGEGPAREAPDGPPLDIALDGEAALTSSAADEGEPRRSVTASPVDLDSPVDPDWLRVVVVLDDAPVVGAEVRIAGVPPATTDARGHASIARAALTPLWRVSELAWVEAQTGDACSGTHFDLRAEGVLVDLGRGGFVWTTGRVVDGGRYVPVGGALVTSGPRRAVAGLDGSFGLWLPADGVHVLEVEVSGTLMAVARVLAGDDADILIRRREALTVRVLGGASLGEATISVGATFDGESRTIASRTARVADGKVHFDDLPETGSPVALRVEAAGFVPASLSVPATEIFVDVELLPAAALAVRFPVRADDSIAASFTGGRVRSTAPRGAGGTAHLATDPAAPWGNVALTSAASIGSGEGLVFGRSVDPHEIALVDFHELELFELTLSVEPADRAASAKIRLEFDERVVPNLATSWMGYGTRFGASRWIDLTTAADGRARILLPGSRVRVTGRLVDGTPLEERGLDISADASVALPAAAPDEVVRLRLVRDGEGAAGHRVRLRAIDDGVVEAYGVSDPQGVVTLRGTAPGAYLCAVEGPFGTVLGYPVQLGLAPGATPTLEVPEPAVLRVLPAVHAGSGLVLSARALDDPAPFPLRSGEPRELLFSRRLDDGFEVQLGAGVYELVARGSASHVWSQEVSLVGSQVATVVVEP